jgi:hypothetical protein
MANENQTTIYIRNDNMVVWDMLKSSRSDFVNWCIEKGLASKYCESREKQKSAGNMERHTRP